VIWWDVVIDVLWPSGGPGSVEHSVEKGDAGTIPVHFGVPGAFTRGVNETGWLADEVVAAGVLRQGKAPSPLGAVAGLTLIEMARPRRSKSLPREFMLAATADRVVAFAISSQEEGMTPVIKAKAASAGPGLASWCG